MTKPSNGKPGPKTEEGKRRSSLNALKHGLTAKSRQAFDAMADESPIDFDPILETMRAHYRPADPVEEELVHRIARCLWRISQTEAMEQRLLDRHYARFRPGTSYESVLRCERIVALELHRTIRTLTVKREAENKKRWKNESPPRTN